MSPAALLCAVALSAGNAEFEKTAAQGAFDIALGRERARLVSEGPAKGLIAKAMLAKPEAFVRTQAAKEASWKVYRAALETEFANACKRAADRLGVAVPADRLQLSEPDDARARKTFEGRFAEERAAACAGQAATLVGNVRPTAVDFEAKDEPALRREIARRIANSQMSPVFEENLAYISQKIVEPVFEAAKRERKRQGDCVRRAKSAFFAPSALAKDLAEKLLLDVNGRKARTDDLAYGWDVFPSVTNTVLRAVVHRRTMERLSSKVAEIPLDVRQDDVAKAFAAAPAKHRKADASRGLFRRTWSHDLCQPAVRAVTAAAPTPERNELRDYLAAHQTDEIVAKAVNRRIDEDLLPKLDEIRRALAKAEFLKTWPTLADRTWYPDAETADATAGRSDFPAAVKAWRELPNVDLPKGEASLEEATVQADSAVLAAFEIARGAVMAQTRLVDEVHPSVLAEARERKDSFWRRTPDFAELVAMLTGAVEARWTETKVGGLWPKGDAPQNAFRQHAELFPSVKKRIRLVAKSILAELDRTEQQEDPAPQPQYSIVVSRQGDHVSICLDHDGKTLERKTSKASLGEFRAAMMDVANVLGKEVLNLK